LDNGPKRNKFGIGALLAAALTLALLPIGLVASIQAFQDLNRLRELQRVAIQAEARNHVDPLRERVDEIIGKTQTLGNLASNAITEPDACSRSIALVVNRDERLDFVGVELVDGTKTCMSRPEEPTILAQYQSFDGMGQSQPFSIRIIPTQNQKQALLVRRPIALDGGLEGWLLSVWTSDIFDRPISGPLVSDLAIGDRFGQYLVLTNEQRLPASFDFNELQNRWGEIISATAVDNTDMLYIALPIAGQNIWALSGAVLDDHEILNQAGLVWTYGLPVLMWVASLFVAVVATNRLAIKPIHNLTKMTRAMRFGVRDVEQIQLKDAPLEFQNLSDSFVEMAGRVAREEALLEQSVAQKSILVKEVHHRVRNNLQLLVSILNMQDREAGAPDVKIALDQFRQRVLGLSAVYERIYEGDDFSQNVSSSVLSDVISQVSRSENLSSRQVRADIEDVSLSQEKAVPVALFASEALSHLIHGSETPAITISFRAESEAMARLTLSVDEKLDDAIMPGLTQKLLKAFALQLNGDLVVTGPDQGTTISLTFATDMY